MNAPTRMQMHPLLEQAIARIWTAAEGSNTGPRFAIFAALLERTSDPVQAAMLRAVRSAEAYDALVDQDPGMMLWAADELEDAALAWAEQIRRNAE